MPTKPCKYCRHILNRILNSIKTVLYCCRCWTDGWLDVWTDRATDRRAIRCCYDYYYYCYYYSRSAVLSLLMIMVELLVVNLDNNITHTLSFFSHSLTVRQLNTSKLLLTTQPTTFRRERNNISDYHQQVLLAWPRVACRSPHTKQQTWSTEVNLGQQSRHRRRRKFSCCIKKPPTLERFSTIMPLIANTKKQTS